MAERKGIMLCYPFEEKRLAKWNPPYIVQPKLDGERCVYHPYEGGGLLLSSQENPFYSVPHIKDFLDSLKLNIKLDGELYCHGMHFEEIVSRVSREVNIHAEHKDIEYHVFDVMTDEPQFTRNRRLEELQKLFKDSPIKIVPSYYAETLDQVLRCYDQILTEGYEGIVVRERFNYYVQKRSVYLMKFKPKKKDEYKIIGYVEEVSIYGAPKGRLGALTCAGDDGTPFNVGTGFNAEDRQRLWSIKETLIGKTCEVAYQHITVSRGVPRFPVFVRII